MPAARGDNPPSLSFSPSSWDYGTIDPNSGATASNTFVLTNSGGSSTGSALTVSLSDSPSFSKTADTCTGTTLAPKKSCSVTVQYDPLSVGQNENATLTASSKKSGALATASLTGTSGEPQLTLSPGTSSDGRRYFYTFMPLASATQTFTLTNGGTGTVEGLRINDLHHPLFVLGNDNCLGQTLAPNGACTFDITFSAPAVCPDTEPATDFDVIGSNPLDIYITLTTRGCYSSA